MRTPFEVDNALYFQALLRLETHARKFVDTDLLSRSRASDILLVCAPLQSWPLKLFLIVAFNEESAQEVPSLDIPDSNVVALVVRGEIVGALLRPLRNNNGIVRPCYKVVIIGRKVNEFDKWMGEPLSQFPRSAGP